MKSLLQSTLLSILSIIYFSSTQAAGIDDKHSFRLGLEAGYFHYEEPGYMRESGGLYGIFGEYTLFLSNQNKFLPDTFILDGNLKIGKVNYLASDGGRSNGVDNYMAEIRAVIGKRFNLTHSTLITPYLGFGFRYLNDAFDENEISNGKLGYERESHYLYVPIGIKSSIDFGSSWALSATIEFDVFITGYQKSHLTDANIGFPDIKNIQEDGYGLRGSLELIKKTKLFTFSIEPYARWWDIKDSNTNHYLYFTFSEPKNESIEGGIRIGLRF